MVLDLICAQAPFALEIFLTPIKEFLRVYEG